MLKNIKVAAMLVNGYIIMIVIIIAISVFAMSNLNTIANNTQVLYNESLLSLDSISGIGKGLADVKGYLLMASAVQDADKQKQAMDRAIVAGDIIKAGLATLGKNYQRQNNTEMLAKLDALTKKVTDGRALRENIQNNILAGNREEAFRHCIDEYEPFVLDIEKDLTVMKEIENTQAANFANDAENMRKRLLLWLVGIVALATVLAIVIMIVIIRAIRRPVNELVKVAKQVAQGDVDVSVTYTSKNEFGSLAASISEVVSNLRRLVGEAKALTDASSAGKFDVRADADSFGGGYHAILSGVNATLDTVVDKVFWYEGMIDSMPNPLLVFDMDRKYTLVNKVAAGHMGKTKEDCVGQVSRNMEGFEQFVDHNNPTSYLKVGTNDYKLVMSYLFNRKGEKAGFVEVGMDITKDNRKAIYQQAEVERLAKNLNLLAQGRLDFDLTVAAADEYTQADYDNFVKISKTLKEAQESLASYIGETSQILGKMAEGNLDVEVSGNFKGEFAQIKTSMNEIIDSLNDMLSQINQSSSQVLSGAGQVASASQALSQGATEQASSIEELSASIEEISNQIKKNAANAQESKGIAEGAGVALQGANEQMQKMVSAMGNINDSAQKISKIIKTIDEIAFQTNILALNAAVEAARAGEAGKGFAVVADEVRNLASKSAEAAKDTTALIENSILAVDKGTKIADATSKTLGEVVTSAMKSGELVALISEASASQAQAIAQTTQGVMQISSVVQTNSATAEESAAASEELSGQADMLNELVGKFKLRGTNAEPSFAQRNGASKKLVTTTVSLPLNFGSKY